MATKPNLIKPENVVYVVNGSVLSTDAIRRATGFTTDPNIEWTHHQEIGDDNIVYTSYGSPKTAGTLDLDLSDHTLRLLLKMTYQASGTVTQDELEDAIVYIMKVVSEDGTAIARTHLYPAMALNNLTFSNGVDADATVSMSFEGNEEWTFLNAMRVAKMEVLAGAAFSTNTTWTPTTLDGGTHTAKFLFVDGMKYEVTATTEANKFKWDSGTDIVTLYGLDVSGANHAVLVCYLTTPAGSDTFTKIEPAATSIMGVKGRQTNIYIGDGSIPSSRTLRGQTVNMTVPLTRREHSEIGTDGPYYRSVETPLKISTDVDFTETDMENYSTLAGQTFASVAELYPSLFQNNQDVYGRVIYYTTQAKTTPFLQMDWTSARITGPATSVRVGDVSGERWTMVHDNLTISGLLY